MSEHYHIITECVYVSVEIRIKCYFLTTKFYELTSRLLGTVISYITSSDLGLTCLNDRVVII